MNGEGDLRSILAIRVKYLTQSAMFSSLVSSERSSMWELIVSFTS